MELTERLYFPWYSSAFGFGSELIFSLLARSSEAGTSKSPTRRHRSPSPDPIADLVLISPPGVRVDINVVSPRLGAMEALASEVGDADEETFNSSSTNAGEQSTFEESPLATSIPLPESDSEAEVEEEGEQPQASTSTDKFSPFIHPGKYLFSYPDTN